MKITKWLFLVSFILFPLGEIIRIPIAKDIVVKPLDIAVGLTTLSYIVHIAIKREITKTSLKFPILSFALIAGFSLLLQINNLSFNQFLASVLYVIRWVAYAGIFFVVSSFDIQFKRKLLVWLIGVGIVFLILGFIQYIFYPDLRNLYYLGWDEHLYRLFSTFLDPNFTGAFLVLFLLLTLYRSLPILSALIILGILLTYSRSAYLMLLVSGGLFLILQKKFKIILGLLTILVIFITVSIWSVSSEGTNLLRTTSSISRIDSAKDAIVIIKSSPILGIGFNAYRYALQKRSSQNPTIALEQHANSSPDTSILFVLATTGIIGFLAYVYMWFQIMKIALHNLKQHPKGVASVFVASTVGLFVNSLFINSLFFPSFMLWMWILLGLTENT